MRSAALRPLLVGLVTAATALGTATTAGAHGGTEIAEGGSGGVRIVVNASETTTPAGDAAVDLATTLSGPGTGDGAYVTYWIRPAGGETFRGPTTTRDDAGIAHVDVPTKGRGAWREWDVSAVVRLNTGKRLRVSNAEANPPGPEPASTAGGGASGADGAETGTSTEDGPTSGGTAPGDAPPATTDAAPATTEAAPATTTGTDNAAIEDVSGEDDGGGVPAWTIVSIPIILALAIWAIVVGNRRKAAEAARDDRD
jgi:hypothetical protein